MNVALVGDVENKFIGWRIKNAVQRDGQFNDTQIRTHVTTIT